MDIVAGGYIVETGDAGVDIAGDQANLEAQNGIGDDGVTVDSIETSVSIMDLSNNAANGIYVNNDQDLQVNGAVNSAVNEPIEIIAHNNVTPAFLAVVGDVTTQGGNIDIYADAGIVVGAQVISNDGDITFNADWDADNAGSFTQLDTGFAITAGNGNVEIDAGENIQVASIDGNLVDLLAQTGWIDDYDAGICITATDLVMDANRGIDVETQVSNLAALNRTSGDIDILNHGNLTITTVGALTGVTNNGGDIDIEVMSDLYVNAPVTTAGGDVSLTADDNIIHNADGDVTTNGGNFTGQAGVDYQMADGTVIDVGGGNAQITAQTGDLTLGQIINGGTVELVAGGNILDAGDTGGEDVIATSLSMQAGDSINDIETKVDDLAASSVNDMNINETDDLTITQVGSIVGLSSQGGDIGLVAGGNITQDTNIPITSQNGDISIEGASFTQLDDALINAGTGSLSVLTNTGGILVETMRAENILLTSSEAIEETTPDSDVDIEATNLVMIAKEGIGNLDTLETQVSVLNAYNSVSGNIDIHNLGTLTIDAIVDPITGLPVIPMITAPDLTNYYISMGNEGGNITLVNEGDIYITGPYNLQFGGLEGIAIYTAGGDVSITAMSSIYAGSASADMSAIETYNGNVTLNASDDISLGYQDWYADINYLSTDSGFGAGNITLSANGDITVDNYTFVWAGSGNIDITAGSNFYLLATTQDDAEVYTETGNIAITAQSGDIILAKDAYGVYSDSGNIILDAFNNVELGYTGTTGDEWIFARNGAIYDNNVDDVNIEDVSNLALLAAQGIGSLSDPIDLADVTRLQAWNTTTNDIAIDASGDLILDYLGMIPAAPSDVAVENDSGGEIQINVHSTLTVDDKVITQGGDVTLTSDENIIHNANGDVETAGGNYYGTAISGYYWMHDDALIDADTGNAMIVAGGDITLGGVIGENVYIASSSGGIIDGGDTYTEIVATNADLYAATGIGYVLVAPAADAFLEISVDRLNAYNSTSGDINIKEENDILLDDVINEGGNITVLSSGTQWIDLVRAVGSVYLRSGGDILDYNGPDINIIAGDDSTLWAKGIIGTYLDALDVYINPGDLAIHSEDEWHEVSVNIVGTVEPSDDLKFLNVPPGLVLLNFRVLGGENVERYFQSILNDNPYLINIWTPYFGRLIFYVDDLLFEKRPMPVEVGE